MTDGTITAEGLTKVFRTTARRPGRWGAVRSLIAPERVTRTAVDGLSLRIGPGELLAMLGPNGAGKSTTIKMLTGILTPHRERPQRRRRLRAALPALAGPAGQGVLVDSPRHPRDQRR